jgi:hypothetical protein
LAVVSTGHNTLVVAVGQVWRPLGIHSSPKEQISFSEFGSGFALREVSDLERIVNGNLVQDPPQVLDVLATEQLRPLTCRILLEREESVVD